MGKGRMKYQWKCPYCKRMVKRRNRHHWLPVRFFGKTDNWVWICLDCHKEVEKMIPQHRRLTVDKYERILQTFKRLKERRGYVR